MHWPSLCLLLALTLVGVLLWGHRRLRAAEHALKHATAAGEQRLTETEQAGQARLEAVFNSMVEGVLLLNPDGRILLANAAFNRLFDITIPITGRSFLEAVRSHELATLVDRLEHEATIRSYELRLQGREERWLEVSAAALSGREQRREASLLVFHDLTRLKQLERTRQEFVANVSHELRTPLSLIRGYLESLLDGAKDDPQLNERFLRTIDRNAQRLSLLIEDLLTISELESGRSRLDLQPLEARAVVTEVFEEFSARAHARQVSLLNRVPPLQVHADPDRLHQILSNLIDNAIKYGREAGQVTVGGRALENGRVLLEVQDDGPGLPPEAVGRVFERFYRVDRARSREQGGTGLGLSIVKHIVQAHGGKVGVESQPGQGTRFHFTLRAPTTES